MIQVKRVVSKDWEYKDNDNEMNAFKEVMRANIDKQDDGLVGIFWYDPSKEELFGVRSVSVNDVNYYESSLFGAKVKTCTPLHYRVWEKEHYRGKDVRFNGDYTLWPRGRVFYVDGEGFVVTVGTWIEDNPEAKDEILFEFDLPQDTEFRVDEHWDLGHGWSDKFI